MEQHVRRGTCVAELARPSRRPAGGGACLCADPGTAELAGAVEEEMPRAARDCLQSQVQVCVCFAKIVTDVGEETGDGVVLCSNQAWQPNRVVPMFREQFVRLM
jgi:hypothetical protein